MGIRWSGTAFDELKSLFDYIERDHPAAAVKVAKRIVEEMQSLTQLSFRGRPGKIAGTREMYLRPRLTSQSTRSSMAK